MSADDVGGCHRLPRWIARLPNGALILDGDGADLPRPIHKACLGARLTPAHKVLLGAIAWFETMRDKEAHPSVPRLAGEVGAAPATVKRLLTQLEGAGLLVRHYQRGSTNVYQVQEPDRLWTRVAPPSGLNRGPKSKPATGLTLKSSAGGAETESEPGAVPTLAETAPRRSEPATGLGRAESEPATGLQVDQDAEASPKDGSGLPAPGALRASGRSPAAAVPARASSPPEPPERDSCGSLVLGTHALGVTADGAGAEPAVDASPSKLRGLMAAPGPQPSRPTKRPSADVLVPDLDSESAATESRSSDVPGSDGAARERAQAADDDGARDHDRPRVADHLDGLDDSQRRSGSTGPTPRRAGEIARVKPARPSRAVTLCHVTRRDAAAVSHASRRSK